MSFDLQYLKQLQYSSSHLQIKSDMDIEVQRETFRADQQDNSQASLITEIYEIIRSIKDPEHPYTLEQLDVISEKAISVEMKNNKKYVTVFWKPPSPNCGYAVHIGMAIIIKLERQLKGIGSIKLRLDVQLSNPKSKKAIDKQLNDKERLEAAKENESLMGFIEGLIG